MQLLWRCFYYFVFHPFPRYPANGSLNYYAFQRAVAFLTTQGTDLLSYWVEEDYIVRSPHELYSREDGGWFCPSLHQAQFARILQSMGQSYQGESLLSKDSLQSLVGQTVDVLVMTQPSSIDVGPNPEGLDPVARRLLGEELLRSQHLVAHKDLLTLLELLLRLRLQPATWGLGFHYGRFEASDPKYNELATILANGLTTNQTSQNLDFDLLLSQTMELFVSFWRAYCRNSFNLTFEAKSLPTISLSLGCTVPAISFRRSTADAISTAWRS